ncbi:hypothetical protein HDE_01526 [Halotydeus destructor]|nr:hypothetical protein HDE_01526 [Halotydeus destructor]
MKSFFAFAIFALVAASCASRAFPVAKDVADTESKDFLKILDTARFYASKLSDSEFEPKVTQLVSAKSYSVGAGMYYLTFEMTDTTCQKGSAEAKQLHLCAVQENATPLVCNVEVVIRRMLFPVLESAACHPKASA